MFFTLKIATDSGGLNKKLIPLFDYPIKKHYYNILSKTQSKSSFKDVVLKMGISMVFSQNQ